MDDTFDIFDPPKQPRERSGREQEHDARISYRKYHSKQNVPCQACVLNTLAGLSTASIRPAVVVRKEGQNETYYCGRHAQEQRDGEELQRDRSKDSGRS